MNDDHAANEGRMDYNYGQGEISACVFMLGCNQNFGYMIPVNVIFDLGLSPELFLQVAKLVFCSALKHEFGPTKQNRTI